MRAPERPDAISLDHIAEAATGLGQSPFLDRSCADINTVSRLHTSQPFRLCNTRFRTAVMLQPGKAFGLANDLDCPALNHFCTATSFGVVTFDIRQITSLSASKGPLAHSQTLDDFALAECRREIGSANVEQLEACLRYYGVRLASPWRADGEGVVAVSWSGGTIYWPNHDGSHHFAAARYIAGLINKPVPITASLTAWSINHDAVSTFSGEFFSWVLPDHDNTWSFIRMVHQYGLAIGIAGMPLPYRGDLLVMLPRHMSGVTDIVTIINASGATPFRLFTDNWLEQQRQAATSMPRWFAA
jgi:hypothetical protein